MSYVSLLKNVPEILSQPTGIAAIASLGIHSAIAFILPLIPVASEPSPVSESPKTVGILELSQPDQNRLPDIPHTLPSELALQPELPQQPELLPPNLDSQRTLLPPLQPPVFRQTPVLSPNISSNYGISPQRSVILPQRPPLPAPTVAARTVPNITPPAPQSAPTTSEFGFDTSGFNAVEQRFQPSTLAFNHSEISIASQPIPVEGLPRGADAPVPRDLPNTSPTTTTATNTTTQTTQPANTNRELIARVKPTPKAQDELALANQPLPRWQPGMTSNTPELPSQRVNEQQGVLAQLNSYENLRQKIQQVYPNSQEKPVIRETIVATQPNVEGTVLGFLVVDPEGKVLDIKFQGESVSPELQSKTREFFSRRTPPAGQQISSYPFSLRFQSQGNTAEANQGQTGAADLKPLPQLEVRQQPSQQQSESPQVVIPETVTTIPANNNSLSSTLESSQKLIQQLRQVRDEREGSTEP
jgi:hypothetical protein